MVKQGELEKIFSALIVPMDETQSVNYDALRKLVDCQMKEGVEGFYCCGSSGEGLLLTLEERKKILETVVEQVNKRVPVIAHVGTIRTSDVKDLAGHAKQIGVTAISMIPPYYYKFRMEEIVGYYEAVIHTVPDMPVIIYNIPQFTGIEFSKENASSLLESAEIIGVKHTSSNLYSMERMATAYPEKIIFNGFDEQYLGALSMGAKGTIGTTVNLFAPLFKEVRRLFLEGKNEEARKKQNEINERVETMVSVGIFNAVKYAWTLRGIDCGMCRSPFLPLSEAQKITIEDMFLSRNEN